MHVIPEANLTETKFSRELVGADYDGLGVCLILVEAPPGSGPSLHRHPYEEVFVVHAGEGTFVAGDVESHAGTGAVVIVPAGVPHRFVNDGAGTLRMTSIHTSSRFETEWLV